MPEGLQAVTFGQRQAAGKVISEQRSAVFASCGAMYVSRKKGVRLASLNAGAPGVMQESLTAVIDYGVGNLFSITSSLKYVGAQTEVTGDAEAIRRADRIVLPGVGAFGDAAAKLRARGLDEAVKDAAADGIPLLGICLGMQLLFNRSFEFGEHEGLGLVSGTVEPLSDMLPDMYKIPQIGWNALQITNPACPILRDTNDGEFVYFVHSYHAVNCTDSLAATTEYGRDVTALVWKDNVFGCQFHPEKSGEVGLRMLRAFCGL